MTDLGAVAIALNIVVGCWIIRDGLITLAKSVAEKKKTDGPEEKVKP